MSNDKIFTNHEIEYIFVRRRYGKRTFTWLHYRKAGSGPCNWTTYGDPWPSVRISKKDLAAAFARIRFERILPGSLPHEAGSTGSYVRLQTGTNAYVIDKFEDGRLTIIMDEEVFNVDPHEFTINPLENPNVIVEVIS